MKKKTEKQNEETKNKLMENWNSRSLPFLSHHTHTDITLTQEVNYKKNHEIQRNTANKSN